ncbi:MAG: sel1 repeat family protein [Nitrospinae bacterium]|nr:sel1 repeat family protein [Nitrospinota bacterium]
MKKLILLILPFLLFPISTPLYADDFQDGLEVTQDYKEAVRWYQQSAKQRLAMAQNNLGVMYGQGQGVTQDYLESVKLYRLSAEQGNAKAQYNLGVMYGQGQGVIKDYVQAHKWFNIARANGEELGRKSRDIIEKRMTLDQISEAQRLAQEWTENMGRNRNN